MCGDSQEVPAVFCASSPDVTNSLKIFAVGVQLWCGLVKTSDNCLMFTLTFSDHNKMINKMTIVCNDALAQVHNDVSTRPISNSSGN